MRSCSSALVMRNLKVSVGTTAKAGASASTTSKLRSGILISPHRPGLCSYILKKSGYGFPGLRTAAQPFPRHANQADKLVTRVNRDDVMFALVLHPVDQECLDIRLQVLQNRVVIHKCLPAAEIEQGFSSTSRAGIKSHDMF